MMEFRNYKKNDYDALIDFLVQLSNEDMNHINWNWARFEWMIEHPDTDKLSLEKIGLWWEKGNIVGAAIYDMYLGEAFCGTLKTHMDILPEILDYAYRIFKDENGLGIAIRNEDLKAIEKAIDLGFEKVNQTENVMMLGLDNIIPSRIPADIVIREYRSAVISIDCNITIIIIYRRSFWTIIICIRIICSIYYVITKITVI